MSLRPPASGRPAVPGPRIMASAERRAPRGRRPSRGIGSSKAARGMMVRARAVGARLADLEAVPVAEGGAMAEFPDGPGIYAVYDSQGTLQFLGLSRKVSFSIANHVRELPDLTYAAKVSILPNATKEDLTGAWKHWMEQYIAESGNVPPGNAPGEKKWQTRRVRRARPEIKLTPGKGIEDLTCSVEDLVDRVVKDNKVVAFIKGTRTKPECGFSYQVLTLLNKSQVDYEVVNVLDEVHNPGVRDAVKNYSQWPTIPQVFVDGELIGGADIVTEMDDKGELVNVLTAATAKS